MKLSPLLAKIFTVVSFAWDVSKLGYLEQSITTVLGYPTSVDVCVVTDAPDNLERVFGTWDVSRENLWVCPESRAADSDQHQYALLWRHRSVVAAAAAGVLQCILQSRFALAEHCWRKAQKQVPSHVQGTQELRSTRHTCTWRTTLRCLGAR